MMKTRNWMWMVALVAGVSLMACGKKEEPTAAQASKLEQTGKKICEKMMDCAMEQLKALPEAQRKMAEGMMATSKEACLGQYGAGTRKAGEAAEKVEYTKEEMDLAIKCMDEIVATSCQDLMKKQAIPDSCKKFEGVTQKKHAK